MSSGKILNHTLTEHCRWRWTWIMIGGGRMVTLDEDKCWRGGAWRGETPTTRRVVLYTLVEHTGSRKPSTRPLQNLTDVYLTHGGQVAFCLSDVADFRRRDNLRQTDLIGHILNQISRLQLVKWSANIWLSQWNKYNVDHVFYHSGHIRASYSPACLVIEYGTC